ncbi:putative nad(p)h dehydrogenase (quinone) fqr1-like 1 [Quercus suber]|uniref:Nad(P)h dehydrogenase (Quinone) fqr1-like 1 n=1 Tax=Quercus suber TaxID=58331 RepID=A0AAW0J618_QUESU
MEDHTIFRACGPHRIEISSCRISNVHNYFQVYCSGINLSALIETFLVNGGSPYGAGTYVGDGSKQPSELKLDVAFHQEMYFVGISRFRQRHCTATIVNLDI